MDNALTIQQVINSTVLHPRKEISRTEYEPTQADLARAAVSMIENKYLPYEQESFKALAKWLARYQQGHKHGLLLCGNVGTGKTYFMQSCLRIRTIARAGKFVEMWKSESGIMTNHFWRETIDVFDSETWTRNIIIDELGQEPVCNLYGTVSEVMEEVLNQRYLDWQKTRALTLVTSNLRPSQLNNRYGSRAADRMREMMDLIEFNGESLRGIK
ncbi:MAG: hypothetical protein WCT39_06915 [Candidatus Margulisiibacteriota bacterium]